MSNNPEQETLTSNSYPFQEMVTFSHREMEISRELSQAILSLHIICEGHGINPHKELMRLIQMANLEIQGILEVFEAPICLSEKGKMEWLNILTLLETYMDEVGAEKLSILTALAVQDIQTEFNQPVYYASALNFFLHIGDELSPHVRFSTEEERKTKIQ